jgi:benzodiazapine receptor
MKIKTFWQALCAIIICEALGNIGSLFTFSEIPGWYSTLVKPVISPPNWIFGPVWTTLFALMGIAAYLVWRERKERSEVKRALGFFAGQFALNILWSVIFFGTHNPGAAFIEIIFLWLAILVTIITFFRVSKAAGWLLIPYIAWVSFASVLNFMIWTLN